MLVQGALLKAIRICGRKQKTLADRIGVHPDKISFWLNRANRIPFDLAIAIEAATEGAVSRYDLAPYARFHQPYLASELKNQQLTISKQVLMAMQYEASMGHRKGCRSDLQANRQPGSKCAQVKGKTSSLAAKHAGFTSRDSYMRAKKVVQHGVYQLIEAMDQKKFSIAQAAAIAILTPSQQEDLLGKDKKDIVEYFRQDKKVKATKSDLVDNFKIDIYSLMDNEFLLNLEKKTALPIRLPLVGLILCYGNDEVFPWEPTILKEELLPHTEIDFEKILDVLEQYHLIERVQKGNKVLGKIVKRSAMKARAITRSTQSAK